jgi:hypothetical protein
MTDLPCPPNNACDECAANLKPKDLCLMPARVALALQADGWWEKGEPKPHPLRLSEAPANKFNMATNTYAGSPTLGKDRETRTAGWRASCKCRPAAGSARTSCPMIKAIARASSHRSPRKCDNPFPSHGAGNRLCPDCNRRAGDFCDAWGGL